jgi:hypothetical protein
MQERANPEARSFAGQVGGKWINPSSCQDACVAQTLEVTYRSRALLLAQSQQDIRLMYSQKRSRTWESKADHSRNLFFAHS